MLAVVAHLCGESNGIASAFETRDGILRQCWAPHPALGFLVLCDSDQRVMLGRRRACVEVV